MHFTTLFVYSMYSVSSVVVVVGNVMMPLVPAAWTMAGRDRTRAEAQVHKFILYDLQLQP